MRGSGGLSKNVQNWQHDILGEVGDLVENVQDSLNDILGVSGALGRKFLKLVERYSRGIVWVTFLNIIGMVEPYSRGRVRDLVENGRDLSNKILGGGGGGRTGRRGVGDLVEGRVLSNLILWGSWGRRIGELGKKG